MCVTERERERERDRERERESVCVYVKWIKSTRVRKRVEN